MVIGVKIEVKDNATAYMRELVRRVPKVGLRETWNLTQFGARAIRESHERTSEKFRGKISKGIRAKKLKHATYGINIPIEGIYLDRMAPHWVSLKRGRLITQWAKERGIVGKSIKVHAHPFVQVGFMRMVNRADITANRIANQIVGG